MRLVFRVVTAVAVLFVAALPGAAYGMSPLQLASQVVTGMLFVEANCATGSYAGSGFLVGPRLMITARHVLEPATDCGTLTVVQQGSGARAEISRWTPWFTSSEADLPVT